MFWIQGCLCEMMIALFFVVYTYNPFQVKVVRPTWPKLQIRQGSELEGLGLIIFHNFVSSATLARGAQLDIILNFAPSTTSARWSHPRHHRQFQYCHVPRHQLRQHLHVPCHQLRRHHLTLSAIQPWPPRLLRRHHLLQVRFNLDHFNHYMWSFSHEHQPRGAGAALEDQYIVIIRCSWESLKML
jgi:hypothetical protein